MKGQCVSRADVGIRPYNPNGRFGEIVGGDAHIAPAMKGQCVSRADVGIRPYNPIGRSGKIVGGGVLDAPWNQTFILLEVV